MLRCVFSRSYTYTQLKTLFKMLDSLYRACENTTSPLTWEYHSFENLQVPWAQVLGPVHPLPPLPRTSVLLITVADRGTYHCPYKGAPEPPGLEVGVGVGVGGLVPGATTTGHPFWKERGFHPKRAS